MMRGGYQPGKDVEFESGPGKCVTMSNALERLRLTNSYPALQVQVLW